MKVGRSNAELIEVARNVKLISRRPLKQNFKYVLLKVRTDELVFGLQQELLYWQEGME